MQHDRQFQYSGVCAPQFTERVYIQIMLGLVSIGVAKALHVPIVKRSFRLAQSSCSFIFTGLLQT